MSTIFFAVIILLMPTQKRDHSGNPIDTDNMAAIKEEAAIKDEEPSDASIIVITPVMPRVPYAVQLTANTHTGHVQAESLRARLLRAHDLLHNELLPRPRSPRRFHSILRLSQPQLEFHRQGNQHERQHFQYLRAEP